MRSPSIFSVFTQTGIYARSPSEYSHSERVIQEPILPFAIDFFPAQRMTACFPMLFITAQSPEEPICAQFPEELIFTSQPEELIFARFFLDILAFVSVSVDSFLLKLMLASTSFANDILNRFSIF